MPWPPINVGTVAALLALGTVPASTRASVPALRPNPDTSKVLIIACNGFPGEEPAEVSVRPLRSHAREGKTRGSAKSHRSTASGTVWTRTLSFGACEEYHVDIAGRELVFQSLDTRSACTWAPPSSEGNDHGAWAVALVQQEASSENCVIREVELPHRANTKAAELAVIDAFVRVAPHLTRPVHQSKEEAEDGAVDADALVRLEDPVSKEQIASEIVASRPLALGGAYAVQPGPFHMVLEDLRGAVMHDRQEVELEAGIAYVVLRVGREGHQAVQQRLFIYRCPDPVL